MSLSHGHGAREHSLGGLLGRLEAVLDEENTKLGKDKTFDLSRTNAIKSRCLYEMSVLMRDSGTRRIGKEAEAQLGDIRKKLEINTLKVKAHMDAVREVAEMLRDVATEAEADGTYSADDFLAYDLS
ncbi:hypothetical protein E2A64_04000 [Pseudohoeflea suaedae]|uniref:Flagellar protein FlgN n=1 Tax=Pseudohoeflea suaedae TaxID=877384 RepID=A0A4R5PMP9_9HYPH|nr:hypothetical protein [Pseudohoeflea suaedae]TDH38290.1 hypothetical protein E2A64_04000 [Pseudohoeflea suaedae]